MHTTSLFNVVVVSLAASWSTTGLKDMSVMHGRALLTKRQTSGDSQAFRPGADQRIGDNCEAAFGPGVVDCGFFQGKTCYSPDEGESCCREGYPCPRGSFCLARGLCCPEGLSPETCALNNGITLSAGLNTAAVTPSASSSMPGSTEPTSVEPTSVEPTSAEATSDVSATTAVIPNNGTYNSSVFPEPFTGAGYALNSAASGAVAAVLGFVGLIGNLL